MTIEEMDQVDQREVDRRVRNYRLQKYLGWAGFALVAAHLLYMLLAVAPLYYWVGFYGRTMTDICLLIAHFALLLVLALTARGADRWIYSALQTACDPFLFEACVYHMGFCGNSNLKQLNLAVAQYYQGSFRQAMDTVMHTDPSSFKKTNRLNYYIIKSALFFRFGEKEQVSGLENEFQRRISGREDQKNMRILCAVNNLKRARENGDLEFAWKFFWEYLALADRGSQEQWAKVSRAWQAGLLEEESGSDTAARSAYAYVEAHGNRLMFVRDARRYLHPEEAVQAEHQPGPQLVPDDREKEGEKKDGGTEASGEGEGQL